MVRIEKKNCVNVVTITESAADTFSAISRLQFKLHYYLNLILCYRFTLGEWLDIYGYFRSLK
jgi:hypothetical protein